MVPNPLNDLAAQVVASDQALQQRVRTLIDGLVTEAERQLLVASPATKLSMIRSVLPAMVKETRAQEQDTKIGELQEQVRELMAATRANIGPKQTDTSGIPTDAPPILSLVQTIGDGVARISRG